MSLFTSTLLPTVLLEELCPLISHSSQNESIWHCCCSNLNRVDLGSKTRLLDTGVTLYDFWHEIMWKFCKQQKMGSCAIFFQFLQISLVYVIINTFLHPTRKMSCNMQPLKWQFVGSFKPLVTQKFYGLQVNISL